MQRSGPERPIQVVTVFGSSRARPKDLEYHDALRLGRLIAEHGWTLCNGGHDGTMEATARGAKEAGGATIGVTYSLYRTEQRNSWLDEEVVAASLLERLDRLTRLGDAFVVLRGGIGTLLELALVWNLGQTLELGHKPIFVVGESWATVVDAMRATLPMRPAEASTLRLVHSVDEAIDRLADAAAARTAKASAP